YSNQGLIISKYAKSDKEGPQDEIEDIYGAISSIVDQLIKKIAIEYKIGNYGTGSFETAEHRIVYVETGAEAILLLVCDYQSNLNQLFPLAYLVAEKVAQILEDSFDERFNSLEIPNLNFNENFNIHLESHVIENSEPFVEGVRATHQIKKIKETEKIFKLIVLGSAAVGKTTLVNQFLKKEHYEDYRPTLGINIATQLYRLQGFKDELIKFLIFDLAGQEFFKRVRHDYYKGANCCFVVYDVTRRETFDEAINFWFKDARNELGDIPFVLIGNKIDLHDERVISVEEGREVANSLRSSFIETSALQDINVQDTFKIVGIGLFFQNVDESRVSHSI
ncbi:MAG: GTP-binding protein, partial [Promethearchaeota archaeon]